MPFTPTPKDQGQLVNWRQVLSVTESSDAKALRDACDHLIVSTADDRDNIFTDPGRACQAVRTLQLLLDFSDYLGQRDEEKCRRAVAENARVADVCTDVTRRLEQSVKECDAAKSTVAGLEDDVRLAQREAATRLDQLRKEKEETSIATRERYLEKEARTSLEKEVSEMQRRAKALLADLEEERGLGHRLTQEIQRMERQQQGYDRTQGGAAAVARERDEMAERLERSAEAMRTMAAERLEMDMRLSAQARTVAELEDRFESLGIERDELAAECVTLERHAHADLEAVQELYRQMVEDDAGRGQSLQRDLADAEDRIRAGAMERAHIEAELANFRRERDRYDVAMLERTHLVEEMQVELRRQQQRNDTLMKSVRLSTGAMRPLAASVETREATVLRGEVSRLENEVRSLERALLARDAEINAMKVSLTNAAQGDGHGGSAGSHGRDIAELRRLVSAQVRLLRHLGVTKEQIDLIQRRALLGTAVMMQELGLEPEAPGLNATMRPQDVSLLTAAAGSPAAQHAPPVPAAAVVPAVDTAGLNTLIAGMIKAALGEAVAAVTPTRPAAADIDRLEETRRLLAEAVERVASMGPAIIRETITIGPSGAMVRVHTTEAAAACDFPSSADDTRHAEEADHQRAVADALRYRVVELEAQLAETSVDVRVANDAVAKVESVSHHAVIERNELTRQLRERTAEVRTLEAALVDLRGLMVREAASDTERKLIERLVALQADHGKVSSRAKFIAAERDQLRVSTEADRRAAALLEEVFMLVSRERPQEDLMTAAPLTSVVGVEGAPSSASDIAAVMMECAELRAAVSAKEMALVAATADLEATREGLRAAHEGRGTDPKAIRAMALEVDLTAAIQRADMYARRALAMDGERARTDTHLMECYTELAELRALQQPTATQAPPATQSDRIVQLLREDAAMAARTTDLLLQVLAEVRGSRDQVVLENARLSSVLELTDVGSEDLYMLGQLHMELLHAQKSERDMRTRNEVLQAQADAAKAELEGQRDRGAHMRREVHSLYRSYAEHAKAIAGAVADLKRKGTAAVERWKSLATAKGATVVTLLQEVTGLLQRVSPDANPPKKSEARELLQCRERVAYLERLGAMKDEEIAALEAGTDDSSVAAVPHTSDDFLAKVAAMCEQMLAAPPPPPPFTAEVAALPMGPVAPAAHAALLQQAAALEAQVHAKGREATQWRQEAEASRARGLSLAEDTARLEKAIDVMRAQMKEAALRHQAEVERVAAVYSARVESTNKTAQVSLAEMQSLLEARNHQIERLREQAREDRARAVADRDLDLVHVERLHQQLARQSDGEVARFERQQRDSARLLAPAPPPEVEACHLLRIEVAELKDRLRLTEGQLSRALSTAEALRATSTHHRPMMAHAQCQAEIAPVVAITRLRMEESSIAPQITPSAPPHPVLAFAAEVEGYHAITDGLRRHASELQERVGQQAALIAELQRSGAEVAASWSSEKEALVLTHRREMVAVECKVLEMKGTAAALEERIAAMAADLARRDGAVVRRSHEAEALQLRVEELTGSMAAQQALVAKSRSMQGMNDQLLGDVAALTTQNQSLLTALESLRQMNLRKAEADVKADVAERAEGQFAEKVRAMQKETGHNLRAMQRRLEKMASEVQECMGREAAAQHALDQERLGARNAARQYAASFAERDDAIRSLRVKVHGLEAALSGAAPPPLGPSAIAAHVAPTVAVVASGTRPIVAVDVATSPLPDVLKAKASSTPGGQAALQRQVDVLTAEAGRSSEHLAREVRRLEAQYEKQSAQRRAEVDAALAEKDRGIHRLTTQLTAQAEKVGTEKAALVRQAGGRAEEVQELHARLEQMALLHKRELQRLQDERLREVTERGALYQRALAEETAKMALLRKPITDKQRKAALAPMCVLRDCQTDITVHPKYVSAAPAPVESAPPALASIAPLPAAPIESASVIVPTAPATDVAVPLTAVGSAAVVAPAVAPAVTVTVPALVLVATVSVQVSKEQTPPPKAAEPPVAFPPPAATQRSAEVQQWEAVKKIKKENDRLKEQVRQLQLSSAEVARLVEENTALRAEAVERRVREASAQQQRLEHATVMDVRQYKAEILRLEADIDRLQRVLRVEKETEIVVLTARATQAAQDVRRLETEVATLRLREAVGAPPQPPEDVVCLSCRRLEERCLEQDAGLLDLRVDRELLALRTSRMERHLRDVMVAVDGEARAAAPPPSARRDRQVQELRDVVETMKGVMSRLQSENEQMKTNSVSTAKYLEAVREVKTLRLLEKELRHEIKITKDSGRRPSSTPQQDTGAILRKLKYSQDLAATYQRELEGLRRRGEINSFVDPAEVGAPAKGRAPMDPFQVHQVL